MGWETLPDRREKQRLILFYKIINGLAPRHLENTLYSHTQHTHGHYTRQQDNIRHILARTDTYINSFFPHSIRLWNTLNSSIRSASSLNTFKSSLNLVYAVPKRNQYCSLGSRSVNSILSSMRTTCSQLKMIYFKMEFYCNIGVHADYQKHNTTISLNVEITPYTRIDL